MVFSKRIIFPWPAAAAAAAAEAVKEDPLISKKKASAVFWRHLFLCAGGVSHSPAFSGTNMAAGGRDHGKFFFSHGSLRKNTLNICT